MTRLEPAPMTRCVSSAKITWTSPALPVMTVSPSRRSLPCAQHHLVVAQPGARLRPHIGDLGKTFLSGYWASKQ